MADGGLVAHGAAEKLIDRYAHGLAGDVVQGEIDRGLGKLVTLQRNVYLA